MWGINKVAAKIIKKIKWHILEWLYCGWVENFEDKKED